jgi:hypothetical protein
MSKQAKHPDLYRFRHARKDALSKIKQLAHSKENVTVDTFCEHSLCILYKYLSNKMQISEGYFSIEILKSNKYFLLIPVELQAKTLSHISFLHRSRFYIINEDELYKPNIIRDQIEIINQLDPFFHAELHLNSLATSN